MAKDKLTDYSATNSLNTDVGGVNIDEGMLPSDVNNALREVMTHLKDFAEGTQAVNNIKFAGATTTGDINFGDNDKAVFGAGSDLQIYHDGSHSYITDAGTGRLYVRASDGIKFDNPDSSKTGLSVFPDSAVYAYYNNALKLETTATGADITGVLTADGLTVDGSGLFQASGTGNIELTLKNNNVSPGSGRILFADTVASDAGVIQYEHGGGADAMVFKTATNEAMRITSAGNVGIGTNLPNKTLTVATPQTANAAVEVLRLTGSGTYSSSGSNQAGAGVSFGQYSGTYPDWNLGQISGVRSGASWDGALTFSTNNGTGQSSITERMRIDSSGNVGIGTSDPNGKLHIQSNSGSSALNISGYNVLKWDNSNELWFGGYSSGQWGVLKFATGGSERMRIDSSGNVGIGTSLPAVTSSTYKNLQVALGGIVSGRTDDTPLYLSSNVSHNSGWKYIANTTASQIALGTNIQFFNAPSGTAGTAATLTERMRLDSSGNLLVGTTNTLPAVNNVEGVAISSGSYGGFISCSRDGDLCSSFNRKTSDGAIMEFRKDGSTVGSIGTNGGRPFFINPTYGGLKIGTGYSVDPATTAGAGWDNSVDLGAGGTRWKDLYLSGGVYLGGTGSANYLDDYEEGTWTPTGNAITLDTSYGYYVKVGKMVTIIGHIDFPLTSDTSLAYIGGIPFTADDTILGGQAYKSGGGLGYTTSAVFTKGFSCATYQDTEVIFRNGDSALNNSDLSGKDVRFQITYYAT